MRKTMKIGKRGSGLAVRLPRELVRKFGLKQGNFIDSAVFEKAPVMKQRAHGQESDEADCR